MHEKVAAAVAELGLDGQVPTLEKTADLSYRLVEEARTSLAEQLPPENDVKLDVVAFGSIARQEMSAESDADYLVIAYELLPEVKVRRTRELLEAADRLLMERFDMKRPGAQGMFGTVISAPDLTERIGLQADTNLTHSQRILLLEESVSIYQPQLHESLIRALLKRYLIDYEDDPKDGVPRFLLNDIERYWRTICVDYQAKRWALRGEGWGLRYLKLIISRKLAFVGTVTSLLLAKKAEVDYLQQQFEMPPLARLAQLHEVLQAEALDSLRQVFLIAEAFATALSTKEFREAASAVTTRSEFDRDADVSEMRQMGRELQRHLETIFFEDPALSERSTRYLSF
jgi:predicted nucleotidyltransferase